MSDFVAVRPCRSWGAWASLAWGVIAIAAWLGAQIVIGDALAEWLDTEGDPQRLLLDGRFVALVTIGAAAVPLAVVWFAVRRAGCTLAQYLGLYWPERRQVAVGLVVLAILLPLIDVISYLAGQAVTPKFVTDLYTSSRNSGSLWLLVIGLVLAAPLVEETVFRGFMLPGLAASRLGIAGALLLTSVLWAVLHGQYQPFYLAQIVVLGILFGRLRLRSGTTTLPVVLHGIVNLVSLVQAGVIVHWQ